jgi:hypothetical protein
MPDLLSQCSRGNAEHRALSVCQAIAAHPAGNHPCQRPTTASAHDQQVTTAAGEAYQDPACRAALLITGSVATLITRRIARDGGAKLISWQFTAIGMVLVPAQVAAATLGLHLIGVLK